MFKIDKEKVFKKLKKQNGEKFAQVIRGDMDHDGDLRFVPNIVHILEFAGHDPNDARMLRPIIDEIYNGHEASQYHTDKDPLTLLSEAGYDAFVVETEAQKNSIKKYYRKGEELCTFGDPDRHKNFYIIHAIKRGADKIKPSDSPRRHDEYGISVISIQIAKSGGFISIKNRYNHTVDNPDATFNNNPDNIIPGLTESLKKYFNVEFNTSTNVLPDSFRMVGDQFVFYNYEINNVYMGPNYYFKGSTITKLNSDYEIMLDYMVLDTRTGKITSPCGLKLDDTCMPEVLSKVFRGKTIKVQISPEDKKKRTIYADGVKIIDLIDGKMQSLNLPDLTEIKDNFVANIVLQEIHLPNVTKIGNKFLESNTGLKTLDLPKVTEIGDDFLSDNIVLNNIYLPNVKKIGNKFLYYNTELESIELPKVTEIGDRFLEDDNKMVSIKLPNVIKIGSRFLGRNTSLTSLELPNVKVIGGEFLGYNNSLTSISLPNVEEIGESFLESNNVLTSVSLPKVRKIDRRFLFNNQSLLSIDLPRVIEIDSAFLSSNKQLHSINAPKLEYVGNNFLESNTGLREISFPNLEEIEQYFLVSNKQLESVNLPKAKSLGALSPKQPNLKYFYAPNVPDSITSEFQGINTDIALMIAQQRVHKLIDEKTKSAKKKIAQISKMYQAGD